MPPLVQAMERAIALQQGWNWFQHRVAYRILDADSMRIELWSFTPESQSLVYTARIMEDETQYLRVPAIAIS